MFAKGITVEDAKLYDRITRLQTAIIDRLSELRKINRSCPCSHFMEMPQLCENYLSSQNYYNKFWQLFLKMEIANQKTVFMSEQVQDMKRGVQDIQDLFRKLQEVRTENIQFKKKTRRRAEDINRAFLCPARNCFRSYGSQLALKVHIKQKHPSAQPRSEPSNRDQQIS